MGKFDNETQHGFSIIRIYWQSKKMVTSCNVNSDVKAMVHSETGENLIVDQQTSFK